MPKDELEERRLVHFHKSVEYFPEQIIMEGQLTYTVTVGK